VLQLHEEIFRVLTPVSLASLIFAAGMFYRKVESISTDISKLESELTNKVINIRQDCAIHAQWDRKIDRELSKISTSLKYLEDEHKQFRQEIRGLLKTKNTTFPS